MVDYGGMDPTPGWVRRIVNGTATSDDYAKALSVDPNAWAGSARNVVDRAIAIAQSELVDGYIVGNHHKKGTMNPSNREKHQNGEARARRDRGNEKGDIRRRPNPNKRPSSRMEVAVDVGLKITTVAVTTVAAGALIYVVANDITGVGVVDDAAIPVIWEIMLESSKKVIA